MLLVTDEADELAHGYAEFAQHFPRPGRVEHAPEKIWQATLTATQTAMDAAPGDVVRAVGITDQRETAILWDRHTLAAARRVIVWQDRRTSAICERLESAGHGARVTELTGARRDERSRPALRGADECDRWLVADACRRWIRHSAAGVVETRVV